jgi:hypothetical protein
VVADGAGRVDLETRGEPGILDQFAENTLGGGRAADVAHADEQHSKSRIETLTSPAEGNDFSQER